MRTLAIALVLATALALALAGWAWRPWVAEPPARVPSGPFVGSGSGERAVVWAVGDGADGGAVAKRVAARIAAGRVDRLLYLGDVYGSGPLGWLRGDGTASDFRAGYDAVYGALAARTAPTPGNHEWPRRGEGYLPYWADVHGGPTPAFYAFRLAGWQLLSLNSQAPHGPRSPQLRWLRGQLRDAAGTCRLAFWHRPRFSAGKHGDAPDLAPLWQALVGRAALVVSGHEHNMQRLRPIDGIVQLVSGAGGHGRYALSPDRRVAFGEDGAYGALRIALEPGRARLRFVAVDGRVLDRSVVRCRRAG